MAVTINGTSGLSLESGANIGIGVSNPTQELEILGGGYAAIDLKTDGGITSRIVSNDGGSSLDIATITNHAFQIYTSNSPRLKITADGNVGIATTSPTYRLQVVQDGDALALQTAEASGRIATKYITTGYDWELGSRGPDNGVPNSFYLYETTNQKYRLVVDATGSFGFCNSVTSPVGKLHVDNFEWETKPSAVFSGNSYSEGDLYIVRSRDDTNDNLGYTCHALGVNIRGSVDSNNALVQRSSIGGITSATAIALSPDDFGGVNHGAFTVYTSIEGGTAGTLLSPKFRVSANGTVSIQSETDAEKSGTVVGPRICLSDTANDFEFALQDTNRRPTIYASGYYPEITLNSEVTTNSRHGAVLKFTNGTAGVAVGKQFVMGPNGTGTFLDIGYSDAGVGANSHHGIDNYFGTTLFRMTPANNSIKIPGHVIQVGYVRYDPNADNYTTVALNTRATSAASLSFTAKYSNSKLVIMTRMHVRIIAANGCSFGIYRDGSDLDGQNQRNAMDFFYKGDSVNHHYTGFCLTQIDAGDTNAHTFAPWGQGWDGGTWEVSYGHGEHSVLIMEIAQGI